MPNPILPTEGAQPGLVREVLHGSLVWRPMRPLVVGGTCRSWTRAGKTPDGESFSEEINNSYD